MPHSIPCCNVMALKSLQPELPDVFVERFRAEATSLARLNHPNITTIYSLIPDGNNLYMVMELVRGHTSMTFSRAERADRRAGGVSPIVAQAADGLGYAIAWVSSIAISNPQI